MARAAEPRKPECEDLTDPQLPTPAEIWSAVRILPAAAAVVVAAGKETPEEKVEGSGSAALCVARGRGGEAHTQPVVWGEGNNGSGV